MIVWIFVFFILIKESCSTKYREHRKTNGFDQRPQIRESGLVRHYLIPQFFEKKRLLDVLKNPSVPLHVKIRSLPTNPSVEPPNIKAGGLLKEWSFDMDETP